MIKGKKSYTVGIGMILAAFKDVFGDDGFHLERLNLEMLMTGAGIITLRHGMKTETAKVTHEIQPGSRTNEAQTGP